MGKIVKEYVTDDEAKKNEIDKRLDGYIPDQSHTPYLRYRACNHKKFGIKRYVPTRV
ncbi:MAG: hypothetical protein QMD22_03690 [archaeon]|nr:hypothetical protein [archaeon]